ncbi:hypothetical protein [Microbispora sp. H10670]|uniref:hypothetical protein n=1 Tax=Microbispora sp. H10670 TaxID=2729108 RepID=UPI001603A635|nr:hypothetical protein [Microbispora sp. H10670]
MTDQAGAVTDHVSAVTDKAGAVTDKAGAVTDPAKFADTSLGLSPRPAPRPGTAYQVHPTTS